MIAKLTKRKQWIGHGAWAITDQGLFTIASVLLNILLARWLEPAAYGAFAVAYSVFLLVGAIHTALFTEPMLIFGAGKYAKQATNYFAVLMRGHWLVTGLASLLLLIGGLVMALAGSHDLSRAIAGTAVAMPFSLLLWFARRVAYLRRCPQLATIASAIYLLIMASGLSLLAIFHAASVLSAMLVTGFAAGVAAQWLIHHLPHADRTQVKPDQNSIIAEHWSYGRWAMATNILMWVPLNLFFVFLSVWVNLEASASLKALTNFILPLLQANSALAWLLLPALSAPVANKDRFKKLLRWSAGLLCSGATLYALAIGLMGKPLLHMMYRGRYDEHAALLWLLLLIPILDALIVALSSAMRSLARPDRVFWAQFAAVGFILSAGLLASKVAGVRGASWAMVLSDLLAASILGAYTLAHFRKAEGRSKDAALELARSGMVPSCQ